MVEVERSKMSCDEKILPSFDAPGFLLDFCTRIYVKVNLLLRENCPYIRQKILVLSILFQIFLYRFYVELYVDQSVLRPSKNDDGMDRNIHQIKNQTQKLLVISYT